MLDLDASFGSVGLRLCGRQCGDSASSILFSLLTNGLNGTIWDRLDVHAGTSVSTTTAALLPRIIKPFPEFCSHCLRMRDKKHLFRTAVLSANCFFIPHRLYSINRMLLKYNCGIDIPSSGTLANFAIMRSTKPGFNVSLNSYSMPCILCSFGLANW